MTDALGITARVCCQVWERSRDHESKKRMGMRIRAGKKSKTCIVRVNSWD